MKTYTFRLPEELVKEFDGKIVGRYGTRSEALREAMRDFITKKKREEND